MTPSFSSGPTAALSVTAALVVIGNEVLSGRTQDLNVAFLGARLALRGIPLAEVRIIRDVPEAIVQAVNTCRTTYDYVFTTGGIGPTHDDVTVAAIAQAFDLPLIRHPSILERFATKYPHLEMTEARSKMADVPQGATLISLADIAAPAFQIENVFVLPGIPVLMQRFFEVLLPNLPQGLPLVTRVVRVVMSESALAQPLEAVQHRFPEVEVGSYPHTLQGKNHVRLCVTGVDVGQINQAVQDIQAFLKDMGGDPVIEEGKDCLERG